LVGLQLAKEREELGTSSGKRCVRQNAAEQVAPEEPLRQERYVVEGIEFDDGWVIALDL
jgi:hypothetical protein